MGEWHEAETMTEGEWHTTEDAAWADEAAMTAAGMTKGETEGEWHTSEDGSMTGGEWTHTSTTFSEGEWAGATTTMEGMTPADMEAMMNNMGDMATNSTATMTPEGSADFVGEV